jgi:hypothetical protein
VTVSTPTSSSGILFYLTNTKLARDIGPITSKKIFTLKQTGTDLTLRVDVPSTTSTVLFSWNEGKVSKTLKETAAPYLMGSNLGITYYVVPYLQSAGKKTVTITCTDSTGKQIAKSTIAFTMA